MAEDRIVEGVIWINPDRVSGAPCFLGTRVPIQALFDYIEGGHPLEDFLEGFPDVTMLQATKVLSMARAVLERNLSNLDEAA